MKDTEFLTVRPIFHWTDQRIAVHIFVCVLAYRLCSLLRKELHRKGIECSINQYLKSMNSINRVSTFYGDNERPRSLLRGIKKTNLALLGISLLRSRAAGN